MSIYVLDQGQIISEGSSKNVRRDPKVIAAYLGGSDEAALREVNRLGSSFLIVEQLVHLMLKHTSRAYVLAKVEVALQGKSEELLASPDVMAANLEDAGKKAEGERPSPESDGRAPAGASHIYKGGVR